MTNWRLLVKHQNLWSKPPRPGDLVEVGYDAEFERPFIGVVTEVREESFGCVLVNGSPKWCDLYDLKPVKNSAARESI